MIKYIYYKKENKDKLPIPSDIKTINIKAERIDAIELLVNYCGVESKSRARRLLEQGAVKIYVCVDEI